MPLEASFLTLQELLDLHARLTERFGGAGGVRDPGLLESALARPRSGYYASLSEQAAALMQSLAGNHAFVDGNKRVAFAATAVFLRMNGQGLVVGADDAERFLVDEVIVARADVPRIADWLERFMVARANRRTDG
ncbi:MAG: type II toxin-antitoxin system death-on-curing family toxin [Alphaproteobacteria bacterium]